MTPADEDEHEVRALYERLLAGWNRASAEDFAEPFADDGVVVGFDGSQSAGRALIAADMGEIFADHETGTYVGKVRSVRMLGSEAAVLRAVAGVVPSGSSELEPNLNAVQTVVAERRDGRWRVVLYQNTPAQFHGRPELVRGLTDELQAQLPTRP